ncbi:class F sortase [Microbacterium trichothecenolyticum]|uniref:Class F sortase n=1 Tax=Microbacterium ureisolvens TaxID=2781186 RepID=A0ABS7I1G6_9MICO|nr:MULTISPECIES: class F sortase [Microbacterium]MBW9110627.1 class F sortase [Microbacterium ureisolvens]MBW9119606.1 class F sortase [Microbacterium trichothecenolyticum]
MARAVAGVGASLAIALALTACGSPPGAAPSAPAPSATATALPTPAVEVPIAAATPSPARRPVPPVRVVAAPIDVDMPVVPVGVETGGFMELPADPAIGGWYRFGADPAASDGNVVISAHVDSPEYPIGPFSRLRDLAVGEVVEVTDAAGDTRRYAVQSVTYYPKADLPVNDLFARSGARNLVLITCGGEFDSRTGRYADNVVAIATPTT